MKLPVKEQLIELQRVKNSFQDRRDFLRLDKNESTTGFPPEFIELFKKEITPDFLNTYPQTEQLYAKIASWLGCNQANIYLCAGSDAGIKAVFEVFVQPGDNVVILHPTYAMFYVYTEMFAARLVKVEYNQALELTADDVLRIMRIHHPKLICIANPNSPTGTVIAEKGITEILDFSGKNNCIVLLDEAYYPFYAHTAIALVSRYSHLLVSRTFSKALGLASARVGFIIAQPEMIEYLSKVRPMYETNAFAGKLAGLIIDNYYLVERKLDEFRASKAYLESELTQLTIPYFKSYANFVLMNMKTLENSLRITEALYKRKILVKAGFKDNVLKNCIRVTIGNVQQMEYFVRNLKEVWR